MDITNEDGYRALTYVAALNRHGHAPTRHEVEEYVRQPLRQPGEGPLSAAIGAQVMAQLQKSWAKLGSGTPAESVVDWFRRLGWFQATADGRVRITDLGAAVLRAVEEGAAADYLPTDLVLTDEHVSYAQLVGFIADAGAAGLIDPYLSIDALLTLAQRTQVNRILIGVHNREATAIGALLASPAILRELEVRQSDRFHDRFVVPNSGAVRMIGTSLNSVGRRVSVTAVLDDAASDGIRGEFEPAWDSAVLIGRAAPVASLAEISSQLGLPDGTVRRIIATRGLMPGHRSGERYEFRPDDVARIAQHPAVADAVARRGAGGAA